MTVIKGEVLKTIFMTPWAPFYVMYFVTIAELIMAFIGAAYVAVHAAEAAVSFSKGLYANYAKWTQFANQIAVFELVILTLFMGWAMFTTIFSLWQASTFWEQMNMIYDEVKAYNSGLEVPLAWDDAFKGSTLCMLSGLTILIAAYSLGEVSN